MGLTRSCSSSSPRPPCWTLRSSTACRALNREPSKIASAAWTRSCASFRKPPTESRRRSASGVRSEEHTSELQSQSNLVCRLLLEKKKSQHRVVALYRRAHDRRGSPDRYLLLSLVVRAHLVHRAVIRSLLVDCAHTHRRSSALLHQ